MLTSLLAFIVVIAICVIIHESGHYLTALANGIQVHEFAFGMGPVLWQRKKNGMLWSVRAIPVGGFVRLAGMGEEKEGEKVLPGASFLEKGPWRRFAVLVAGSLANILLALLLTAILLAGHGVIDMDSTKIGGILAGYPAEEAGIKEGDEIVAVDGAEVETWAEMSREIRGKTREEPVTLRIKRGEGVFDITTVIPVDPELGYPLFGIQPARVTYGPLGAVLNSVSYIWNFSLQIIQGIYTWIAGKADVQITGPVGIAAMAGEAAKSGFWTFVSFLAMINLHLGILNLLPFPALDGGRLILVVFEIIFRRRLPEKWEQYIHLIGFALLIALLLAVTWKDIIRMIPLGDR
ncbi:MAG: RIP metalloprotease RseP [Thermovirgaceae bacterium]